MSNERFTRLQLILSLNLLVWCFLWSRGNNDTLIHYPFITVVQRELPNNTLQIRPPSYNSFCRSQYIIWKTHSALSSGHALRIIVGDTFRVKPKSGAFFPGISRITLTYLSLPRAQQAIQGQRKGGTGSYRLL